MIYLTLLRQFWPYVLIGVLTLSTAYYRHSAQSTEREFTTFKVQVETLGKQAEAEAKRKDAANAKQISAALTDRNAALKRLRDYNAGRSVVPYVSPAPAGSSLQCFDPPALAAALERFRGDIAGIVAEGDAAQVDAATFLKAWPK